MQLPALRGCSCHASHANRGTVKRALSLLVAWMLAGPLLAAPAKVEAYADSVASLIDPAKLATLGVRQANPRVEKYVALLADAKAEGVKPGQITTRALALVGMKGAAAKLTHQAMLRNLVIAERLGCLDEAGLAEMRKGLGATIHRGL